MAKTNKTKEVKEVKADVKKVNEDSKDVKKMNLFEKMAAISNEIGVVTKDLVVSGANKQYTAVSETAILTQVKALENKYRVYSYPASRTVELIEGLVGKVTMRVATIYRFVNIDKPAETLDVVSYGDGVDTNDKAPGKAMTYADKYALMKAYKIPTGDDPDATASPDVSSKKEVKKKTEEIVITTKVSEPVKPVDKAQVELITEEQIKKIKALPNMDKNRAKGMFKAYKIKKIEELTKEQGDSILRKLTNEIERNKKKAEAETETKKDGDSWIE